jgi:hypothetical protein
VSEKYVRRDDRDDGALLRAVDVARKLGLDTRTVIKWIKEDPSIGFKRGGRWYVYRSSLADLS